MGRYPESQELFEEIKNKKYKIIEEWVEDKKGEDVHLDFKTKSRSDKEKLSDDDRKNLGKSISSFSNTAGGILFWGISTKNNKKNYDYAKKNNQLKIRRTF